MRRITNILGVTWLSVAVVLIAACSDSEDSPLVPNVQVVSEVSSPVDSLLCRHGYQLVYEYRGAQVYGDMLLQELDVVLGLVESNLFLGEDILFVVRPGSFCGRLIYSTSGDVVVQTCGHRDSGGNCMGGRFFSFSRVDETLVLLEVGEWVPPGGKMNGREDR